VKRVFLSRWIYAVALAAPVVVAAALIPLRDDVVGTNIALLLVVVVVAVAATGNRIAAALSALSAAGAFNFFHTEPYYSLRIDSRDDVETAVLLLLVGLAVGELASQGLRARAAVARGRRDLASIQGLGALVADGEDADYVVMAAEAELTDLLGLQSCRFETDEHDARILPVIARDGSVKWGPTPWEADRWGMPTDGAVIPVWSRGVRLGRFVLIFPVAVPYSAEQLAQAVALVDQAGAALAARPAST
jgi:K+-sensing histidine kinase KdpD